MSTHPAHVALGAWCDLSQTYTSDRRDKITKHDKVRMARVYGYNPTKELRKNRREVGEVSALPPCLTRKTALGLCLESDGVRDIAATLYG